MTPQKNPGMEPRSNALTPEPGHTHLQEPDTPPQGRGRMVGWFVAICVVFGVIGAWCRTSRKRHSEQQVLAQQTDKLAVPYVEVIHATPVNSDSEIVLPGSVNAYVYSRRFMRAPTAM